MIKSNHSQSTTQLFSLLLFLPLVLLSFSLQSQMMIRGEYYYDEVDGNKKAKVKVFQDNKVWKEFETNNKGKFKILLPIGHDYLFEISKKYHFTTKAIISTKLPEEIDKPDFYASFDIVGDLIRNFKGLDGSIMDKPILIFRYIPEEDVFGFDEDHLNAIRDRVERLMDESEKLKKKGADPIAKPLPKKARKTEEKKPEIKEAPVIEKKETLSSKTHENEEKEPTKEVEVEKPKTVEKKVESKAKVADEAPKVEVDSKKEVDEDPNETEEMRLRRERLEREKKRKQNLALKRGYESSLIRQVAEENRKMSQAELQRKSQEKEDESLIERARKEAELKEAISSQKEAQAIQQEKAIANKQTKSQLESGMIREVAASSRAINATSSEVKKAVGEETEMGKKYILKPSIRENTQKDDFKKVENLFVEYPSYTVSYSKETYNFGMVNYYIDNQTVEKSEFCKALTQLSSYKIKLRCD